MHSAVWVQAEQIKSVKEWIDPETADEEEQEQILETENPVENDEQEVVTRNENPNKVGIDVWDIVKMIFATLFVIALIYFLLKFINKRNRTYSSNQLIQNIGGTSLGANRSIQIVKIGDRLLVVGVGESIELLTQIEDEEEVQRIIAEHNDKIEQLVGPSDMLTKLLQKTKSFQVQNREQTNSSFPSIFKSQLNEMSTGRKKLYEDMEKKGTDER